MADSVKRLAEVSDMWPLTVTPFTEMCGRGRGRGRLSTDSCGRGRQICGRGRRNVRVRTSLVQPQLVFNTLCSGCGQLPGAQ